MQGKRLCLFGTQNRQHRLKYIGNGKMGGEGGLEFHKQFCSTAFDNRAN